MGPYCRFCNQRCFVPLPMATPKEALEAYGSNTIVATCHAGQEFEMEKVGWNYDKIRQVIDSKPRFNRRDIAIAYYFIEFNFGVNGRLWERPRNVRQGSKYTSTASQLHNMGFDDVWQESFFDPRNANALAIYKMLLKRYGFSHPEPEGPFEQCHVSTH